MIAHSPLADFHPLIHVRSKMFYLTFAFYSLTIFVGSKFLG
jgi:hypothetical protein